ncbi:MAG TPA: DEAD/DEAH box helicase family protein [Bacillus sp. (in: firmicutes)]|nr:DEAD/DEAH box helicase family protein [Bacillus sp. (in: firmicutes)]
MSIIQKKIGQNYIYQDTSGRVNKWLSPNHILKSWKKPISFIQEDSENDVSGLRSAQLGAVYAIKSHWTVSNTPATIVMPTGTGKTETMIATMLSEQCRKTLIVVPSKLLREQTVRKCVSLGVLRKIGVIPSSIISPSVSCLQKTPSDISELEGILKDSNILVATVSLLKNFEEKYIELLVEHCSTIIIDEAHHIAANTWSRLKRNFLQARCLQFTATPFRNDGKKIDGKIIYNFPLKKAQAQKYFQPIDFLPIHEFDEEESDKAVAKKAVETLEEDIKNNLPHIILVRAKSKERAKLLFEEIYQKNYSKYKPVLIISGMGERNKRESLRQIETLESRILVCVDMFGEGIDIPNLKIAAIHDKYKSLPITLQFIGRFARTHTGLGNASIIANIANEEVGEALSELYAQDSDWNELLNIMADMSIGKELSLQELSQGFKGTGLDGIKINQIIPKVSMIPYKTSNKKWNWSNWTQVFDEGKCRYYINEEKKLLIIMEKVDSKVEWTYYRDINNINWNLHILYWNEHKKMFFINTTDKSIANKMAESIFGDFQRIVGEEVFRCLHGINRLMLATVGLNSAIDGPIRYKMFAGIDISQGLSEAQKENSIKSNLFGVGYNGFGKVSIGCSYKGTIWSKWVETIDYWIDWCDQISEKILNPDIDVSNILKGALIPVIIKERPKMVPYKILWPIELELRSEETIGIELPLKDYPIYTVEIGLINNDEEGPITFYVGNRDFREEFELIIEKNKYHFRTIKSSNAKIYLGKNKSMFLADFFNEYPPTIKFVDQSTLQGNYLVSIKTSVTKFNRENIIRWDWSGTNIRKESQGDLKEKDSIQYKVIEFLKRNTDYSVIFDDDNSGEIADVITISERENSLLYEFYHCKYSHGNNPGARVSDLYEVCGQAEKSVGWMQDTRMIIERMIKRENLRLRNGRTSRFEKGDLKKLKELKNKMKVYPSKAEVYIVQPGVDSKNITPNMESLLCGSSAYLMETYSIPLKLICS